ncbi:hypothetical protein NDU88_005559 [Pleurodeles waltl]|uniref:Uncharacterized protein n=1 Tax=Pleurodeles waltl TaxID=8319 RepID=A0AAV7L4X9_PLEWA|nr:hypothetical protein NDU88_005559 [Pleurodeles waltl]
MDPVISVFPNRIRSPAEQTAMLQSHGIRSRKTVHEIRIEVRHMLIMYLVLTLRLQNIESGKFKTYEYKRIQVKGAEWKQTAAAEPLQNKYTENKERGGKEIEVTPEWMNQWRVTSTRGQKQEQLPGL